MYLVVGATGPIGLGGEICRLLRAAGNPTRALVRPTSDAKRVDALRIAGVELVEGDLKDPLSLRAACRNVRTVISTASVLVSRQPDDTVEGVDGHGQNDLIDAAKSGGVDSFVYTSFSSGIDRDFPFRNAKREVEHHLRASGLAFTILRPTFYMEVWLTPISGFDYVNHHATIFGTGHNKISWLSFHDVARFALECIGDADARNATFELGGPEALPPSKSSGSSNKQTATPSSLTSSLSRRSLTNRHLERIPGRVQSPVCGDAMRMAMLSICGR